MTDQPTAEPAGYVITGNSSVEGDLAKRFEFSLEEAKKTASVFAQHYETVSTRAVYYSSGTAVRKIVCEVCGGCGIAPNHIDQFLCPACKGKGYNHE